MLTVMFIGGMIFGGIITYIIIRYITKRNTGYGYFKIEPYSYENPELYKVNVQLFPDQYLLSKDKIILHKDPSQKLHRL